MQVKYPIAFLAIFIGAQSLADSTVDTCPDSFSQLNQNRVLQLCQAPADEGQAHAATVYAQALLSTKTPFMPSVAARLQGKELFIPLSVDDKVHLFDAKDYLKSAVEQGNSQAQFLLAMMELQTITNGGILVGEHLELLDIAALEQNARDLLLSSAKAGNQSAIEYLAANIRTFDKQNRLVDVRVEDFPYLEQMAQSGQSRFVEIYNQYLNFLAKGQAIQSEPQQYSAFELSTEGLRLARRGEKHQTALRLLKLAADKGDGNAHYFLAQQYAQSAPALSLKHLQAAAKAKHGEAMHALANHYGCNKDVSNAIAWYKAAIDAGIRDAEEGLAEIEQYGDIYECSNS